MQCGMGTDCAAGDPVEVTESESVFVSDEVMVSREPDISALTVALGKLQEDIDVLRVTGKEDMIKEFGQLKAALAETIGAAVKEKTSALQEDLSRLEAEVSEMRASRNDQEQKSQKAGTSNPPAAQVWDESLQSASQANRSVLDWRLAEARMADHKNYELRETIWDITFFLGMKAISPSDEFIVFLVGITNVCMQVLFIILVEMKMTAGDFNDKNVVQEYLDWRVMYAHDPKYADAFTDSPLADAVCTLNPINMEGTLQASTYNDVHTYLEELAGFHSGELLCMLANVLWVFACVRECENSLRLLSSLWATVYHTGRPELEFVQRLLSARSSIVFKEEEIVTGEDGEAGGKSIKFSCSFRRALWISISIIIPRLAILMTLGYVGARFLVSNIDLSEFILNSVALDVVLNVDEILYDIFVPAIPRMILARTFPLHRSVAHPIFAMVLPYGKIVAVAAIVALIRVSLLGPIMTNIEDVERVMCSGNKDFLASQVSIGSTFAGRATTKKQHDRNKLNYLAILQRTGLEDAHRAGPDILYLDSDRILPDVPLFRISDVFQARLYQSLTVGQLADARTDESYALRCHIDKYWQVVDPSSQHPISKLLEETFAPLHPTCQALKGQGYCYALSNQGTVARFFCPQTCGLGDPHSGNAFDGAAYGVPSRECQGQRGNVLTYLPCEDLQASHPSFEVFATSLTNSLTAAFALVGNASYAAAERARFYHLLASGCEYVAANLDYVMFNTVSKEAYDMANITCAPDRVVSFGFPLRSLRYLCPLTCGCAEVSHGYKMDGKYWTPEIGISTNCPKACFNYSLSTPNSA